MCKSLDLSRGKVNPLVILWVYIVVFLFFFHNWNDPKLDLVTCVQIATRIKVGISQTVSSQNIIIVKVTCTGNL